MEARKMLIEAATDAAMDAANRGHSSGVLLHNQAMDPADLLTGAGFANVTYDNADGTVAASWTIVDETSSPLTKLLHGLAKTQAQLPLLQAEVKILTMLRLTPWKPDARGQITLCLDYCTNERSRKIQHEAVAMFGSTLGFKIVGESHDQGSYGRLGSDKYTLAPC